MSGSLIGGIAGAVIGLFTPMGPAWGWMIGATLGGLLFPGPGLENKGPTLQDLKPQSSEYGKPIPIVYGTVGISGNVIWAADLIPVETTTEQGGKGGPSVSTTTTAYYADFAVLVCEGVRHVGRIWAGPEKRLIWDGSKLEGTGALRIYTGTETQLPDPLLESHLGVGNVPAYRGYCYLVLEKFPLVHDGNRISFLTVEVGAIGTGTPTLTEYFYPVTGSDTIGTPGWTMDYTMVYNSVTNRFWGISQYDPYAAGPYDSSNLFQIMDSATGHVTAMLPRPNDGILPRDPSIGPCPDTYENVALSDLLCDPIGDRIYLASPAYLPSQKDFFPTYLFEFVASTGEFVRATRLSLGGSGKGDSAHTIFLKYNKYNGDIWCIIGYAASVAYQPTVNLGKLDKSTSTFAFTLPLTFNGQSPATMGSVSPAQVRFTPDGRVFVLPEVQNWAGAGDADLARTLFEVSGGIAIPVTTLAGGVGAPFEFWYDFFYEDSRNTFYLFSKTAPASGSAWSGTESVWTYELTAGALLKLADLPASTQALYNSNAWDKAFLPAYAYDVYRDLIWYCPKYESFDGGGQHLMALHAADASLAYDIPLVSTLDPTTASTGVYYDPGGTNYGTPIFPRPEGVYLQAYAYDSDNAAYDDRAALLKITIGAAHGTPVTLASVVDDLSRRAGLAPGQYDVSALTDMLDGYAIARQTSVRAAIDALRPVYYFDGVESSGIVRYVKRGGVAAVEIDDADLGAHTAASESADPLLTTRQMEVELPRTLNVSYLLAATDYSAATKRATRLVGASGDEKTIEVPLVLTDAKAQEVAEVNLHGAWVQRLAYQISLPRKYACLEPTDLIVVRGHLMRLTKITASPQGVYRCEAVADDASYYAPHVVVTETPPSMKEVYHPGPTRMELM